MRKFYLNARNAMLLLGISCTGIESMAQQRIIGTVRTRSEYRDGLGNLPGYSPNNDPALFTSQRTNMLYGYKWDKLDFQVQLRDVRVWGQDASSINNADGAKLFLHEAWGEFTLATTADTNCKLKIDNLSLKLGRQELVYDDVRLLGNLDWLQQGRRHDAAVLKFLHKGFQVDLGGAFNQNTDGFGTKGVFYNPQNSTVATSAHKSGVGFTLPLPIAVAGAGPGTNAIGNMYKSMQFLYASRKFGQTKYSLLVFKDDFAKYVDTAVVNGVKSRYYYTDRSVNSRYTAGINVTSQIGNASGFGKIAIAGGAFTQKGTDKLGNTLDAYMANLSLTYMKGKFQVGPAIDYLSGNSVNDDRVATKDNPNGGFKTNRGFDPLYGTPHKWWGYMDYFYVGTGAPSGGLINGQLRAKYTSSKYFITVDYHNFKSDGLLKEGYTKDLGNEIDVTFNYNINKFVNMELGYSKFFGATDGTQLAKGQVTAAGLPATNIRKDADWAYVMFTIRPDFLFAKPIAISPTTLTNEQLSNEVKDLREIIEELRKQKKEGAATEEQVPATEPAPSK